MTMMQRKNKKLGLQWRFFEAQVKDILHQGKCHPLVLMKLPGVSYQCNTGAA